MTAEELLERYAAGESDFSGTKLRYKAQLNDADLRDIRLDGASLERIQLIGSNLAGASLKNVIMLGSRLERGIFCKANLSSANLSNSNMESANLQGAILQEAIMSQTWCKDACFSYSDLRGARMGQCYVKGCDFSYADLRDAFLEEDTFEADLSYANFRGAQTRQNIEAIFGVGLLCNTTLPDGTVRNDDC